MVKNNEDSLMKLRKQHDEMSKKYWDSNFKLNELTETLAMEEKKGETMKKQLENAIKSLDEKVKLLNSKNENGEVSQKVIADLQAKLKEANVSIAALTKDNEKLTNSWTKEKKALKALNAEMGIEKNKVASQASQIDTLTKKIDIICN